jgi:hypothetical protein
MASMLSKRPRAKTVFWTGLRGYEVRVTPKHSLFMTMAFPKYSFDSPLQVAVGFESFLEPATAE